MKITVPSFLLLFLFLRLSSYAQFKPSLNDGFNDSYFYKINDKQALDIYTHPSKLIDTNIFFRPFYVNPYDADSLILPQGNYLKVYFENNRFAYEYTPITTWRLYVLDNQQDLIIQLLDLKTNKPVIATSLFLDKKKLQYDAKTNTYILPNNKRVGILSISDKNETFFFNIGKKNNYRYNYQQPFLIDRLLNKMPFRYLTNMYRLYNKGTLDLYLSLRGKKYWNIYRETMRNWNDMASMLHFNKNYRNYNYNYSSYFYFNKLIYREGDTIKFKAHFLNNKKQEWFDKPVLIYLNKDERYYGSQNAFSLNSIFLGKLVSKRKAAGYDFEFSINDTMDIKLDKNYTISVIDLDSNYIGNGQFRYEDYELKKAVFKIDLTDGEKQYKGKQFGITFTAKDENELPMPDTRASIVVLSDDVSHAIPDKLFVPDTLWQHSFNIVKGEEYIIIPDSIFPPADIDYNLVAVLQNSENETEDMDEDIEYSQSADSFKIVLNRDSILITQKITNSKKVHLFGTDRFSVTITDTMVLAPCSLPLNTHVATYYVESDHDYSSNDEYKFDVKEESSGVFVDYRRTVDSIFFSLNNSKHLPIIYHLYKTNKEIAKGTDKDFPFVIEADENSVYYLLAEYVWAGESAKETYTIQLYKDNVKLVVEQPAVVTPGKETTINITATDYKGFPVKDLNLLAYSYTQKFGETHIPYFPRFNAPIKTRNSNQSFELTNKDNGKNIPLNYLFWNSKMMLDTDWVYRFRYPSKYKVEYTQIATQDSITQIAPFVMEDGIPQPIVYVFIDNIPVYFGFTNKRMPYSFEVDTNYHELTIRTEKKQIIMDSFKVKPYVKTLFSIDQNNVHVSMKSLPFPDTLTETEKYNLNNYVMEINMPGSELDYAYLENSHDNGQYIDLSTLAVANRNMQSTIGPIYWRYWNFRYYKQFKRRFEYEPNYSYYLNADVVKMKSRYPYELLPKRAVGNVPEINDFVLTKKQLLKDFDQAIYNIRRKKDIDSLHNNMRGHAYLTIEYNDTYENLNPLNIMLTKPGNFDSLNIYSGTTTEFNRIEPGSYQLFFIDMGNLYSSGVIEVKENGSNFYRITSLDIVKGNTFKQIHELLNRTYQSPVSGEKIDIGSFMNQTTINGNINGFVFSGKVLDGEDENEPLIGASIKLVGNTIGTQADIDGNFEIVIPNNNNSGMLEISYAGYETQTIRLSSNMRIVLKQGKNALTEVVITTPYGPPIRKGNYVGAADVVTSKRISNTPVSDVTMAIEGAAPGVNVTNGNGEPGTGADIRIRGRGSLNGNASPLIVINGAIFNGDITSIDPSMIGSINILKDATATSIYGARGANGVIIINTKRGAVLPENIRLGLQALPPTMTQDMMVSSLRNNFRDDAYWQPDLVTDENGKASFKVKFPDDITNWKTLVIATDDKKHTGYAIGNIKSYKPVAASLYLPHFLLDGDSAFLIGKSVNYIPDTIPATTTFYQNDILKKENKIHLGPFYNDTLLLTDKGADSIKLKYLLTKENGYFDGEEKTIPLQRVGVKVAEGGFVSLDKKDTSFTIYPTAKGDTLHLSATASLIDILLDEINVVRDYGYMCNEQKASKILAFLTKQKLYASLQKTFDDKDKRYVQGFIDKIIKSQNSAHQWGWWDESSTIPWISNHVLKALMEAKSMGYNCNIDTKTITSAYVFNLEKDTIYTDLPTLQLLAECGIALNYEKYISRLERSKYLSLNTSFELILLRQKLHLPYKLDKLIALKESDIFGNIYWKDTAQYVYGNEVLTTLNAFKIIRNDTTTSISPHKIINWLIQQRTVSGWRNTYESSNIIEALATSIPLGNIDSLRPTLQFNGGIDEKVEQFPYKKDILLGSALQVQKSGYAPVYFSWYYNKWDTSNVNLGNNFRIHSRFESTGKNISTLPAGVPVTMKVKVHVEKSAEFVMIEIPIPAGCSYQSKGQFYSNYEIHREYFEDKVSIFCEKLPKGDYEYTVELLPRYAGNYTLNPAKAELMYFPVFYGREQIKRVNIKNN